MSFAVLVLAAFFGYLLAKAVIALLILALLAVPEKGGGNNGQTPQRH